MHTRLRQRALIALSPLLALLVSLWGHRDSEGLRLALAIGVAQGGLALHFSSGARSGGAPKSTVSGAGREAPPGDRGVSMGTPTLRRTGQNAAAPDPGATAVSGGSRSARASRPSLYLAPPRGGAGRLDLRVTGIDPRPPRSVDLWRIDAGAPIWLGRTASEPDGAYEFSPLLFGGREVALVAAPGGEAPDSPGASPVVWARRPPVAPAIAAVSDEVGNPALRIVPAENAGAVLVEWRDRTAPPGARAAEAKRFSVDRDRDGLARAFELAAPGPGSCLGVRHQLPDGRHSSERQHCGASR